VSRTAGPAIGAEKKSLTAAERNPYKRAWYWRKMKQVEHERLKFLDESGVTTTLTRRFGRATPGERINEAVPKNYGPSTSVVSVIGVGGVETAMLIEGAVDTLVFDAVCEQCLRPCLRDGDVLVLDNLGAHRAQSSDRRRIRASGGRRSTVNNRSRLPWLGHALWLPSRIILHAIVVFQESFCTFS